MKKKAEKAGRQHLIGMEREDYLHAIYGLEHKKGHARISDIAKALGVSKPSASQMMHRLEKEGYLLHEPYVQLKLTKKGKSAARSVNERNSVLREFFTVLGIAKKVQEHDIHGIEHYLSPVTLKKLRAVTKFLSDIKK